MPAYTGTGTIERVGDADWFAVNLTAGQVYVLSSNTSALALTIRDPFGNAVRAPSDPLFGGYAFRASLGGTYYVEAGGVVFPGTLAFTGAYSVAVTSVSGDPIRGDTFTDRTIAPGENYMVSYPGIQAAQTDDDWWASELTPGRSYQATTSSGQIYVVDAAGNIVENDNGASVQFTPQNGGRYFFAVSPTGTQSYTIRLDAVTDDYADNLTTTGFIAAGGSPLRGTLEVAGDEDWLRAELDASRTYGIFPSAGTQVSVYDSGGRLVANDVVAFQPQQSGRYFLSVSGTPGTYSVGFAAQSGGIQGNTTTTAELRPGDGPVAAQLLGAGDQDWYRVTLQPGRSYAVSAPSNVTVAFYDAGGQPVFGSPTGDVRSITPTGTVYYVAIGTSERGATSYGLSIAAYTDDYGSNFINRGQINPETVVNAQFEVAGDRDWFAVDLRGGTSYFVDSNANIVIRDANFQPVTTQADKAFTPQFNGLYYVEAIGSAASSYSFAIRAYTDDYVDNNQTRGRLTEGTTPTNPTNPTDPVNPGTPSTTPTTGNDSLTGSAGNDTINGLAGDDTIRGLGGDDVLTGGPGNDLLDGGAGSDTADYSSFAGGANVNLNIAGAQNTNQGADTLVSIENVRGGAGGDVLVGDDNANVLEDRVGGNDNLIGNGGDDTLTIYRAASDGAQLAYVVRGGAGNDTIAIDGNGGSDLLNVEGNEGDDTIDLRDLGSVTADLGTGNDSVRIDVRTGTYAVTLGSGSDVVVVVDRGATPRLANAITISDFSGATPSAGGDILDLRQYFPAAFPSYAPTADPYADGRLRLVDSGGGVQVQIDRDGTGTAFGFETLLTLANATAAGVRGNIYTTYRTGGGGGNVITGTAIGETLTGTADADSIAGLGGNDVLMGNAGDDTLEGGNGDDTLNGGAGNDRMDGGAGSDTYLTESAGDVIVEARGGGFADTVYAVNSYTLSPDAEVENFAAATGASTVGLTLTGNQFGQAIAGTYGNDTIRGGGGGVNGGDILIGLRGDDVYVVDASNVLIFEESGEGNDTALVLASGSGFVLNAEGAVETLQAETGTAAINITGNMGAQAIVGNAGNNQLSTGGGGADTLDGGLGDDTYRVHGTVAIVDAGGNDAIYTSGSFRLNDGPQIELISTAVHLFTGAIDLMGNVWGQTLVGNFGANVLDGGAGADTLIGLQGADTFRFSTNLGSSNIDQITDFVSGTDRIALASDVFSGVGASVTEASFGSGRFATTAEQRITYVQETGELYYDADGLGGQSSQLFAVLAAGTPLAASDFTVVPPVGSM